MNIGFLKKILAGLPVLLFTLGIVPSQALALANLVVTPSSASPGQEVELRVSGVTDQQYFCIYIEGTPAEYNSCNTEKPTKFATTGVNVYKVTIPADVATQNVAFKVPVYTNAKKTGGSQVLSAFLKVNTAAAQTTFNIAKVTGCDKADTGCQAGKVVAGGVLHLETNVDGTVYDSVQVYLDEAELQIRDFSEGTISAIVPIATSLGTHQVNVTYQGQSAQVSVEVLKATGLPDAFPAVTGKDSLSGAQPPNVADLKEKINLQDDLDCAALGLAYDPNSKLCLPANTIAANKDSLAGSLTVGEVITRVIKILLILAGVVAVLFLMIGGYQYIMSRGNPEMAKQGRSTMTSAIIGLVAVLLSYTIVNILTNFVTLGTGSLFK